MSLEVKATSGGPKTEADLFKTAQEKTTPDKTVPAGFSLVPDTFSLPTASQQSEESVGLGYCARFQTRIVNIVKSICNSLAKLPLIGRFFIKAESLEEEALQKAVEEAKQTLLDRTDELLLCRFNKKLNSPEQVSTSKKACELADLIVQMNSVSTKFQVYRFIATNAEDELVIELINELTRRLEEISQSPNEISGIKDGENENDEFVPVIDPPD